mmetsp:Transcript_53607/g.129110  ORF Transcript_53607/g.129110 Transcript_53607/m.129110 type:complete len:209 (-) Transcript_53607:191-817(-)
MSSASHIWAPPATRHMPRSTGFLSASLQTSASSGAASTPSAVICSPCWRAPRVSSSPGCASRTSRRAPLWRRSRSCPRPPPACPTASLAPRPPPRRPHAHSRTRRSTPPSRRRSALWQAPRPAAPSLWPAVAACSRWPSGGPWSRRAPRRRRRTAVSPPRSWASSWAAPLWRRCCCWGAASCSSGCAGAAAQSPCRRRLRIRSRWRTP